MVGLTCVSNVFQLTPRHRCAVTSHTTSLIYLYRWLLWWFVSLLLLSHLPPWISSSLVNASVHRTCMERIWPDFQRCRERQLEHFRQGRFSSGITFGSSDSFQPKYKMECCSYWELLECVHKAAKVYCSDDINLKKLDKTLEIFALNVPIYMCTEEYPKGTFRCKIPSWFILSICFGIFIFLVLLVLLFICIRNSK